MALANLLLLAALTAYQPRPWWFILGPITTGCILGQLAVVGVVAALAAPRMSAGLLIAVFYALASDYAITTFGRTGAIHGNIMLEHGFIVVGSLAIWQGLRFSLEWRLSSAETTDKTTQGQYRLIDLLEWMTTIAFCLGSVVWLNHLIREAGRQDLTFLDCTRPVVQVALLGAPIAVTLLSVTPPTAWRIAALALWSALILSLLFAFDLRFNVNVRDLLLMALRTWPTHLIAFGVVIVGNSLLLRRFGLRCRSETKPAQ